MKWFSIVALTTILIISSLADVIEPATGLSFKDSLNGQELAGVGVREKKIGPVKVKVYGVGMYMDEKSALSDLAEFAGKAVSAVKSNQGFFSKIVSGGYGKTIELKMARTVGSETMAAALAEAVLPRMKGDAATVKTFEELLVSGLSGDGSALKGTSLTFGANGSSLEVSINNKKVGDIASATLCNAFVDVYLGKDGVSPALKESIAENICAKL